MKIFTLVFGLLISVIGFAQGVSIHGSVLDGDYNKEPLAFFNAFEKNILENRAFARKCSIFHNVYQNCSATDASKGIP